MTKKRIFAWIALLFFVFIVVNILFLHFYVTASAAVFLMYVLLFYFGNRRNMYHTTHESGTDIPENDDSVSIASNMKSDEELQE